MMGDESNCWIFSNSDLELPSALAGCLKWQVKIVENTYFWKEQILLNIA
jgi:hypothetical protein